MGKVEETPPLPSPAAPPSFTTQAQTVVISDSAMDVDHPSVAAAKGKAGKGKAGKGKGTPLLKRDNSVRATAASEHAIAGEIGHSGWPLFSALCSQVDNLTLKVGC